MPRSLDDSNCPNAEPSSEVRILQIPSPRCRKHSSGSCRFFPSPKSQTDLATIASGRGDGAAWLANIIEKASISSPRKSLCWLTTRFTDSRLDNTDAPEAKAPTRISGCLVGFGFLYPFQIFWRNSLSHFNSFACLEKVSLRSGRSLRSVLSLVRVSHPATKSEQLLLSAVRLLPARDHAASVRRCPNGRRGTPLT
jgi:hypothetical protein